MPSLKGNFDLCREDCQQAVTDEFLCMVVGCVLGTDVCHWMFKTKSAWCKVKKIPLKLDKINAEFHFQNF